MGKKTDRLYITHSEWSSSDSFGAASGFQSKQSLPFKRLPFNVCALSLQPFTHPVCVPETGHIFELTHILPWLKKHGTNPVTGDKLSHKDLLKLHISKNESGEYCDPVTFKVFTDNTHIVAIKTSGNVFAWDTVDRLNVKAKMWRDLVSDDEFKRSDIITLQDPQNLRARDMTSFKYVQEGTSTLTPEEQAARDDPMNGINSSALGTSSSAAKILAAKAAVAKARADRAAAESKGSSSKSSSLTTTGGTKRVNEANRDREKLAYNAAQHTTGKAAASLTSTAVSVHTTAERATLTDEEYMLKPKRVKIKGYARIVTNLGNINIELYPEFAPKAVWNFVQLAKKGYYKGVRFHRSIRNFMIQGGDPTGTGRGGSSIWGKPFNDEFEGPLIHDSRGIISMANKGKNTNTSQFFILYGAASHLDRKHTVFAKVVGGLEVLDKMEKTPTGDGDRPLEDITMKDVVVFVDPFEEFLKKRQEAEEKEREEKRRREEGTEEDMVTWTGKRVRGAGSEGEAGGGIQVGKYLKMQKEKEKEKEKDEDVEEVPYEDEVGYQEPVKKKAKSSGGFGNFDNW